LFSKAEIEYLKGTKTVDNGYARYLRHSIKRKLNQFEKNILPILLENENTKTWLLETVREIPNS